MLGPVDLSLWLTKAVSSIDYFQRVGSDGIGQKEHVDWVIAGGESGPHARPTHPDWVRNLRDQCVDAGVPFHFKQMGTYWAKENAAKDKKGGDWDEWPDDLKVRQFPHGERVDSAADSVL
jgi:protein gp37